MKATRTYIAWTAVTGFLKAALIVAQVLLIAYAIAPVITDHVSFTSRLPIIWALIGVALARVAITTLHERYAHRAADRVVAELRAKVLHHSIARGPRASTDSGAETVTLLTQGLEDLRPYFVRYVPQLILAATVTPATLLVVIIYDWVAGLTILFTIPLIPLFMALVGWMTQSYSTTRLAKMRLLNAEVIDLLAGLPTLRGFGRELGPIARVKVLARSYTKVTMQTLKVAFLSGAVLEFLATLSVALVAVGVGMRLVTGLMVLLPGLVVIMLAPECFHPLRQVGAHFHASADGIAAADAAFDILNSPTLSDGSGELPHPNGRPSPTLQFHDLTVHAPGRDVAAPAALSGVAKPGEITALVGPSGAGKTTAVMAALGLVDPDDGFVSVQLGEESHRVADLSRESWHRWCTWVPQRPAILPATVLQQFDDAEASDAPLLTGGADLPSARLEAAAELTGLGAIVASLPDGWDTFIGHGGYGLSVGQAQRLALTRALVSPTPVMILDEPSAHLDSAAEDAVLAALAALKARGCTVLVVAHRSRLIEVADAVLPVTSTRLEVSARD
ncbi:thiol reductant ABC exporter subunit CydD [Bowdeniella nasicola]|uniref:thiol reductant ABC exporter subunit CydD n=1 Tax=Bowdeniella nasicola TaxID=208480 RepID=UPI000B1D7E83|nr:thiol reductant ABC exporter subunit CydD [Bowdeniella nasicola]